MDSDRFDQLARRLSREHRRSRRGVLRTAAGSLVVGLWTAVRGSERAAAQIPPPLCPEWVLAQYPWLCEGNEPNTPNNSNNDDDKKDNDKDDKKDNDGGNPCKGQPDGTCCAGANGKKWCQSGACQTVPATRSIAECQGFCAIEGSFPGTIAICGQTVQCPLCTACDCTASGSPNTCEGTGAHGPGVYCVEIGDSVGTCNPSPCPGNQVCCSGGCFEPCTS